jgi:PAS domain S-box-containing protein
MMRRNGEIAIPGTLESEHAGAIPGTLESEHAGEMRERVRSFDWAATSIGARETWPESLRWSVDLVLASGFPMAVHWGSDLIQIYNDAYAGLLGEKHPAALGRPAREIWPEIYDRLGPLCEQIMRGERDGFFAEDHPWLIQRYGVPEEARFTISYSPIADARAPHGIGGLLTTSLVTTERVRNERVLRILTEQLEAEVEQRSRERDRIWTMSEDLLGVSNFDGYFTSVNPAWTRLLGWSEAEIKSLPVNELRHPEDAAEAVAGRERLLKTGGTVRLENRFRHRDGSWRWIAWTLTADDGLIYVAGRHVTAEKQANEALRASERQFRSFVDGVVDYALIMLNPDGIVASWNAGAERIKGYTAAEIIGKHFSQFYTPDDRASNLPGRSLDIARAAGKFEAEAWRLRKDGTQFFANVVIDAIRDEDGDIVGFAKITRDITEQRAAKSALERAQQQLAQAQKMEALGQLTGGVAHDFNNLLMIVSGQAQTLLRRLDDPKNVRSLEAIIAATARGESLTRQLLTFARRQPLNPRTVCPSQIIAAFHDMLASSVRGNVKLDVELAPELWAISIDIAEFELALVNLVVNARDAMPDGGIVRITADNVVLHGGEIDIQLTGDFLALTVSDTGEGIPADILGKVFEPFFTTKSPGKGTGLGLSQVYGLAQQSGGGVGVESTPGRGTAVTIYLPRSHAEVDPVAAADAQVQSSGSGEKILVVEDNPEVKTVAVTLLEQLNYRTHAVDNARAALDLLDSGASFDLLFSDVMLPGEFDGLDLARIVQQRYPEIPVVLTSGYAKALAGHHGLPILRKPYRISALAEVVRENLRRQAEA